MLTTYPLPGALHTDADSMAEHRFIAHLDLEDRAERGAYLATGGTITDCPKCERPWVERYGHDDRCPDHDWGTAQCYTCVPVHGVERAIVGDGPIVEPHRDPTASYRLECGHVAI